jgi:predicted hydrolase (HD superfamily)
MGVYRKNKLGKINRDEGIDAPEEYFASDNDPDHTIAQEGAMLASARAHNQGSEKWHKVAHKMHTRAAILSKTAGDEEGAMIHLQHADMHAAHFKH